MSVTATCCLSWWCSSLHLGAMRLFFFLTRGSQTGPVPNNTHSHLHNPSVPKGRRGRETEHLRRQEKEKNREGDEKKRMERERKRGKCIEKKMMGEKKGWGGLDEAKMLWDKEPKRRKTWGKTEKKGNHVVGSEEIRKKDWWEMWDRAWLATGDM